MNPFAFTLPSRKSPWLYLALAILILHWMMMGLGVYGLMFDEAQYWLWGKLPAFGYYSKPPMIGWLIGTSTAIFGDSVFGVKAFAPLLHGLTALLVWYCARALYPADPRIAHVSAFTYLTLPAISGSSAFIATDTPLLFFWTLGLYALLRAKDAPHQWRWWLLLGVAAGGGLLSKYTMIAFGCSAMLALAIPKATRPLLKSPGPWLAAMVGLILFSPNILWNLQYHFVTLTHTQENVVSKQAALYPFDFLEFFAAQFLMLGPIIFGTLLLRLSNRKPTDTEHLLQLFVLPLLIVGLGVSLAAGAQAQWVAPIYPAAVLLVVPWLIEHRPRMLNASLILHLILLGLLYAAPTITSHMEPKKNPFSRLFGWNVLAPTAIKLLEEYPNATLVTDERKIAAALTYQLRKEDGTPHIVYKWPKSTPAHDHYDLLTNEIDLSGKPLLYFTRMNPRDVAISNPSTSLVLDTWAGGHHTYVFFVEPQEFGP